MAYLIRIKALFVAFGFIFLSVCSYAQVWPQGVIKIIAPFPAGGPSDMVVRLALEKLQANLKQTIIIENIAGASGNIGASLVAKAKPDGYTWLIAPDSVFTLNPHMIKNTPFKVDDLKPIAALTSFSQVLVCHPSSNIFNLNDFVNKIKSEQLNYASGGIGSAAHISMELLLDMTGAKMTHVPYKGAIPATQDVLAGHVPCGFLAGPAVLPYVNSGRLNVLATSGSRRSPSLPEIKTVAEQGIDGYEAEFSLVLFSPIGVSDEISNKFRSAIIASLNTKDNLERLKASDQILIGSIPEVIKDKLSKDSIKWAKVIKKLNLALD